MRARDLVYETSSALLANRARSLLTILGIVIGIAAVIAMTAMIGGLKMAMVGELGLSQARLVNIACWYNRPMELSDAEALADEMKGVYEYVTPLTYGSADVSSTTKKANGQVMGVLPDYAQAMDLKMVQGRFFNEKEASSAQMVVVLDQASVRILFGSPDAQVVGKTLRVGSVEYSIVGVTESTSLGGGDFVQLYMPYSTCAQRVSGYESVDQLFGFAYEGADMDAVAKATEDWLAKRFQVPDDEREYSIYVLTMQSVIDQLNATMASFQVLMTAVASISLVVGGIGIMNMMLTNVTERIREIGLRKALGARRRDITRQFLLESVCLTLVGGVIGIAVGYLGSFALAGIAGSAMMGYDMGSITPYLDWQSILMVAGICVAIGIVFGYYPAHRAARLDPVESLHYQ